VLAPERLSRFLTYVLRHKPRDYPLAIDRQGFAAWQEVVDLVQQRFYDANEQQIRDLINGSEKKRFELRGDRVRATYGHSFPLELNEPTAEPPAQLFFSAARDIAQGILRNGLKPRDRQYVHLSRTAEEAASIARRLDPNPAVLVIDAQAACDAGVRLFEAGPLFLAEGIPARYLSLR